MDKTKGLYRATQTPKQQSVFRASGRILNHDPLDCSTYKLLNIVKLLNIQSNCIFKQNALQESKTIF
jgi:hypothetical protein